MGEESKLRCQAGLICITETADHLIYGSKEIEIARLRKGPGTAQAKADPDRFTPAFFDELMSAANDPLAEKILSQSEPSYDLLAAALPPVRDVAFVGSRETYERPMLWPDGRLMGTEDEHTSREHELVRCDWLDGSLPALRHLYETPQGQREQLTFVTSGEQGETLLWQRIIQQTGQDEVVTYLCGGQPTPCEEFYQALFIVWSHWDYGRARGIQLNLPEPDLVDAAVAMVHLGLLTFRGLLSRYGVGTYDKVDANSFPPAVIFLVQALMGWGHLNRARDVFSHYLSRYVNIDGTLDYHGPAVAEYGQLLSLVGDYVSLSGNRRWFMRRLTLLRPMWQRLVALRQESLQRYPAGDPHHGLIPGLPEADYHTNGEQWNAFYYSGDVWACRGLLDLGLLMQRMGLNKEGIALASEAMAYKRDIEASLRLVMADNGEFVPPSPDQPEPIERLTPDPHFSYCNYRYLPEMVSAGILDKDLMRKVSAWRRAHAGELLGMTRFKERLDDWPALHYARALLETDDIDRYLLLLYAHWTQHCAQGSLAAYEQVQIRPDESGYRRMVAGQVVPCQVMVPIMLRWALVYEERDTDVLWLGRAMPRRWLQPGRTVRVKGVPTHYGNVGFTVRVLADGSGKVVVRLPKELAEVQVKLRLRAPEGKRLLQAVHCDQPCSHEGDTIRLPRGVSGRITLDVQWE